MSFKILIVSVLFLGLFLRIHNYTSQPPRGASSDEYTYTFLGMSLLQKGVPISWSYLPGYLTYGDHKELTIDHIYFPLVWPYFDHPPLNGLLVGGWSLLNGETSFEKVKISTIRQVPIALSVISSILLFLIALKLYGKKTAFWSLIIYSTGTLFVLETRTVFAENLLTPLFLLSITLYLNFRRYLKMKHIFILAFLSGLSFWAKELGIVVLFSTLFLMIYEKIKLNLILAFVLLSGLFCATYLLYGYYYNWDLFLATFAFQSLREIGPNTFIMLFFSPYVVNKLYFDGWYILGFISFFVAFLDLKKFHYILIPSFAYFMLMLSSLTQHGEMGWYMIPMFPFFSILTAEILTDSIKKKTGYILVVGIVIGMYIIRYYYEAKFGLPNYIFRLLLAMLMGPLFALYILRKQQLFSVLSNLLFYALILMTIYITYYYIHPI